MATASPDQSRSSGQLETLHSFGWFSIGFKSLLVTGICIMDLFFDLIKTVDKTSVMKGELRRKALFVKKY